MDPLSYCSRFQNTCSVFGIKKPNEHTVSTTSVKYLPMPEKKSCHCFFGKYIIIMINIITGVEI